MKILAKILWGLVYALPAVLFFSYYPIISLGGNSSMNFELSLPLIWLVFFDLGSLVLLILLWRQVRRIELPGISDRRFFLLALLPLYLTLSIFWSENPLRGILTAGVVWLIFVAIFAILYILPQTGTPQRLRYSVLGSLLISGVLVGIWCFIQSILDTLGWSRENTLMCAGCSYRSFGFPHPSGFAIEPQFMGNLLLAPTLTALYLLISTKVIGKKPNKPSSTQLVKCKNDGIAEYKATSWQYAGLCVVAGFLSLTLFFTFSRGAIYAYGVALTVMMIMALRRRLFRWVLIAVPVISFTLSLVVQGTFAEFGPTSESFGSAVSKSLHQLSLGIIDLRSLSENTTKSVENYSTNCGKDVENTANAVDNSCESVDKNVDKMQDLVENTPETVEIPTPKETDEEAIFEGYVPESTNIRLSLNKTAVKTWWQNPKNFLIGVGLGGAGTAMHNAFPDEVTSPKEIVQNEPFSLLLETGLIGIVLVIFELLIIFLPKLFPDRFLDGRSYKVMWQRTQLEQQKQRRGSGLGSWQHSAVVLLLPLLIAYFVTLNFFSGLPNALQIYLMPPLLYLILQKNLKKALLFSQNAL